MKKYFQKCGHLKNTIIICQTIKDKIIGGYTPLSFNTNSLKQEKEADESESSFVFSLTQNEKFRLLNKNEAIYRYSNQQIGFGNHFFSMSDKGNKHFFNTLLFNEYDVKKSYQNNGYKYCKQTNLKFNGNKSSEFVIKQWEVLKVHF